jgi:hypothetical protein
MLKFHTKKEIWFPNCYIHLAFSFKRLQLKGWCSGLSGKSTCLASMRLWIQTQVPEKKKKKVTIKLTGNFPLSGTYCTFFSKMHYHIKIYFCSAGDEN